MNHKTLSSALLFTLVSVALSQTPEEPKVSPARQADVSSMDNILKAVYDVISGPVGQKRDWDRMRSLFVPNARLSAALHTKKGDLRYFGTDVDGYIKQSGTYIESRGFFERELSRHVDTYGNIAQVFSTYESRWKLEDEKPFERGINSFQLLNDGKRWWVVSIYWQGEDEKRPIPRKWLKR